MIEFVQDDVGPEIAQAVSVLRDEQGELLVGDVLRRTCQMVGNEACKQTCLLAAETTTGEAVAAALRERGCSDLNLYSALDELRLPIAEVLMVSVTGDKVGFADRLDEYKGLRDNPYGWREIAGFNAFFARDGEVKAIGSRMADCADINFEFQDSEGNTVFGFEHGTRTNMFGSSKYAFEGQNGQEASYTEYVLDQAIEYYSADPKTVRINLAAAIKGRNNEWKFDDAAKIEELLPGWYEDGFLRNMSNPEWGPEDPIDPDDEWQADTRGLIIRDIEEAMENLGIPAENLDKSDVLDPNESQEVHSSHKTSCRTGSPATRDLYIVYVK